MGFLGAIIRRLGSALSGRYQRGLRFAWVFWGNSERRFRRAFAALRRTSERRYIRTMRRWGRPAQLNKCDGEQEREQQQGQPQLARGIIGHEVTVTHGTPPLQMLVRILSA
jgi:hypothetical protein